MLRGWLFLEEGDPRQRRHPLRDGGRQHPTPGWGLPTPPMEGQRLWAHHWVGDKDVEWQWKTSKVERAAGETVITPP